MPTGRVAFVSHFFFFFFRFSSAPAVSRLHLPAFAPCCYARRVGRAERDRDRLNGVARCSSARRAREKTRRYANRVHRGDAHATDRARSSARCRVRAPTRPTIAFRNPSRRFRVDKQTRQRADAQSAKSTEKRNTSRLGVRRATIARGTYLEEGGRDRGARLGLAGKHLARSRRDRVGVVLPVEPSLVPARSAIGSRDDA